MAPIIRDEQELQAYGLTRPTPVYQAGATPQIGSMSSQQVLPLTPEPEPELGVWDYAEDIFFSGASGVGQAVQETTDLVHTVGNYIDNRFLGDSLVPEENPINIPKYDSKTTAGAVTGGIAQFVTGFVGAGKLLKPIQAFQKLKNAGTGGAFAASTLQGAIADFGAFDPREGRFANVLQDVGIQNAVVDYLAADEKDGDFEGRFKNALEGAALGAMIEPIFRVYKAMRGGREAIKAGDPELAQKVLVDASDDIDSILRGDAPKKLEPGTSVEVFDAADSSIKLKQVKPDGTLDLKDGERLVTERTEDAIRLQEQPKPLVDVDYLKEKIGSGRRLEPEEYAKAFNMEKMLAEDSVKDTIEIVAKATSDHWDDGVQTLADVRSRAETLAERAGASASETEDFVRAMSEEAESMKHVAARMKAAESLLEAMAHNINKQARNVIATAGADSKQEAKLLHMLEQAERLTVALKTVKKEGARLTGAGRLTSRPLENLASAELDTIVSGAGGSERVRRLATMLITTKNNTPATMKMLKAMRKPGFWDHHNEYWINSILSGPKTHAVNVTSNIIQTLVMPMDRIVGGALTMNPKAIKDGVRLYTGLYKYTSEALKYAGQVLLSKDGQAILDAGHKTLDAGHGRNMITASNLGMTSNSLIGKLTNLAGGIIRVPSRLLGAEDEFFKQINYRARVYADLVGKAVDEEGLKNSHQIAKYVEDNFEKFFHPSGAGKWKKAMTYSQQATFTQDLERGFSKSLQTMAGKHPAIRVVLPFIRTPANIIRQVWQRTPLIGKYQFQLADELASSDEVVKAAAHGKVAIGAFLWTSAILAAGNGRITGAGPKNPKLREMWLEDGNQPYSVITYNDAGEKVFTQYNRLDPFGMFFGLAADYTEIAKHVDDTEASELAIGMVVALTRNLTSKTYLKGVIDFINVVNDPERWGERYIERQMSTYVPFSGLLGQVSQHTDGTMREIRSVADAMTNRIPGLSESLPAKRSWITGDEVLYPNEYFNPIGIPDLFSPFPQKKAKNNLVLQELQRMNEAISGPSDKMGNVKLTSEQFSRLNELHGRIRINKRTMSEELERLFTSEKYDINRERIGDVPTDNTSFREVAVGKIIRRYRDAANRQLLEEFPDLKDKYVQDQMNERAARRGMIDKIKPILK